MVKLTATTMFFTQQHWVLRIFMQLTGWSILEVLYHWHNTTEALVQCGTTADVGPLISTHRAIVALIENPRLASTTA